MHLRAERLLLLLLSQPMPEALTWPLHLQLEHGRTAVEVQGRTTEQTVGLT
jgi:hypothetical protein